MELQKLVITIKYSAIARLILLTATIVSVVEEKKWNSIIPPLKSLLLPDHATYTHTTQVHMATLVKLASNMLHIIIKTRDMLFRSHA